jgi:hypothetical protein
MVIIGAAAWIALSLAAWVATEPEPEPDPGPPVAGPSADRSQAVRSALARGKYPWYDAETDAIRPVPPPREPSFDWLKNWRLPALRGVGDFLMSALVTVAVLCFLALLVALWRRYRPIAAATERGPGTGRAGAAAWVEQLPPGVRVATDDPWAEAARLRARGDYAGAVICLFAHQLRTLDRLGLIRLVPGRTGRQLVGTVADPHVRAWVEPTLRLFEAVYYGHRTPSRPAFEGVWALAEALERRVASGPVS